MLFYTVTHQRKRFQKRLKYTVLFFWDRKKSQKRGEKSEEEVKENIPILPGA